MTKPTKPSKERVAVCSPLLPTGHDMKRYGGGWHCQRCDYVAPDNPNPKTSMESRKVI